MLSHSCLVHGHSVPERGRLHHFDSRVKTFCELRKKNRVSGVSDNSYNEEKEKKSICARENESHKVKVGMGNRNFHRTAISTFAESSFLQCCKKEAGCSRCEII